MWRSAAKLVVVGAATTALALLGSGAATAADSGRDYGQHVRMCAQTMGFDGAHNPGMHNGFAGWDPSHVCSTEQQPAG